MEFEGRVSLVRWRDYHVGIVRFTCLLVGDECLLTGRIVRPINHTLHVLRLRVPLAAFVTQNRFGDGVL